MLVTDREQFCCLLSVVNCQLPVFHSLVSAVNYNQSQTLRHCVVSCLFSVVHHDLSQTLSHYVFCPICAVSSPLSVFVVYCHYYLSQSLNHFIVCCLSSVVCFYCLLSIICYLTEHHYVICYLLSVICHLLSII